MMTTATVQGLEKARRTFLEKVPKFKTFENPGQRYLEGEDDYKREAIRKAKALLGPYVGGEAQFTTDQQAQDLASEIFDLTNFLNWRDKQYIGQQLLDEDGAWVEFMNSMVGCLAATPDGPWEGRLGELLDWLVGRGCKPNISKLLPTYFLFLWDADHHIAIKTRAFNQFLMSIGEDRHGGKPLTVKWYQYALGVCRDVMKALEDWKPRDMVDVHGFIWIVSGGWKDVKPPPPKTNGTTDPSRVPPDTTPPARPDIPLNLIFAGPPGTGKTHQLLTTHVEQFEEIVNEQSLEEFVLEECADLKWHEVCVVALTVLGRPAQLSEVASTVPATVKGKSRGRTAQSVRSTLSSQMRVHTPEDCAAVNSKVRFEPSLFWKDEDGRYRLLDDAAEIVPELVELGEQIRDYNPKRKKLVKRHAFVTFHQSYSYEDFVEGIKPVMEGDGADAEGGQVAYAVQDGIFKRMVARAMADPKHSYALFIDEVNRANISNVFGELITLLEPDKRMTWDASSEAWVEGVRVKLPYTHSSEPAAPAFGVPDNLYVIGTMNTADRSIALLDLALRRRFTFREIMPDPTLLKSQAIHTDDGEVIQLDKMLDRMNQRIEFLYDRDHTIGHSYLMRVESFEDLERVFRQELIPLLQEYFYGDWEKIQLVLGDLVDESGGQPKPHKDAIIRHVVQDPVSLFGFTDEAYQQRRSYEITDDLSPDSFRKIYEPRSQP